jgi:hypothetical protein
MPKRIDAKLKERCTRLVLDHLTEYPSLTAACHAVARREGVGYEDNALMESVIGLFKTKCIRTTVFHAGPYRTIADVEYATSGWVDWYETARDMFPPGCC